MSRTVDTADLVGASEIAQRLGVTTNVVHQWKARHDDFPKPVAQLKAGLIWAWPDVLAWSRATGLPGAAPSRRRPPPSPGGRQ